MSTRHIAACGGQTEWCKVMLTAGCSGHRCLPQQRIHAESIVSSQTGAKVTLMLQKFLRRCTQMCGSCCRGSIETTIEIGTHIGRIVGDACRQGGEYFARRRMLMRMLSTMAIECGLCWRQFASWRVLFRRRVRVRLLAILGHVGQRPNPWLHRQTSPVPPTAVCSEFC